MSPPRDVAASIRARLLAVTQSRGERIEDVRVRFAQERWLERLGRSRFARRFVLAGDSCLRLWVAPPHRPAPALRLLHARPLTPASAGRWFREVCAVPAAADGLAWVAPPPRAGTAPDPGPAGGVRVDAIARLGEARIPLLLDVAFGDVLVPRPERAMLPALLAFPPPSLLVCRPETHIAARVRALSAAGPIRLADHVDLWLLGRSRAFDGRTLALAIATAFAQRGAEPPHQVPAAIAQGFVTRARERQWVALRARWHHPALPASLASVLADLRAFLGWPLLAAARPDAPAMTWPPGGPWIPRHGDVVRERRVGYGRPVGRRWHAAARSSGAARRRRRPRPNERAPQVAWVPEIAPADPAVSLAAQVHRHHDAAVDDRLHVVERGLHAIAGRMRLGFVPTVGVVGPELDPRIAVLHPDPHRAPRISGRGPSRGHSTRNSTPTGTSLSSRRS